MSLKFSGVIGVLISLNRALTVKPEAVGELEVVPCDSCTQAGILCVKQEKGKGSCRGCAEKKKACKRGGQAVIARVRKAAEPEAEVGGSEGGKPEKKGKKAAGPRKQVVLEGAVTRFQLAELMDVIKAAMETMEERVLERIKSERIALEAALTRKMEKAHGDTRRFLAEEMEGLDEEWAPRMELIEKEVRDLWEYGIPEDIPLRKRGRGNPHSRTAEKERMVQKEKERAEKDAERRKKNEEVRRGYFEVGLDAEKVDDPGTYDVDDPKGKKKARPEF